ncbi:MAG TPA: 50S ribosomal protein L11 methyltransferase [Longimicrobiaceae bacterium]|nr:50S ribosomal protein L11 methyltransferase [Longimicrobiaceae bacterium]
MPAPRRWLVLTAHVQADDPLRDLLAEGLLAAGGLSVLDEQDRLTTYLPPPEESVDAYVRRTSRFLADWIGDDPPDLTWRWHANEDWEREWKRGLRPRKVSPRFVVKPSWTEWRASPEEIVIEIDPQMAFGTGEHPTTRGCLRLLDSVLQPGDRVLDVGSGSGILSIAAARAGAGSVIAVDFDPDANVNARENIERNRVGEVVEICERMADPQWLTALGPFDLILANILSGVIRPLLPVLARTLKPGGRLIVSGILQEEADPVVRDADAAGFEVAEEDREEEWWSAVLRRSPPS